MLQKILEMTDLHH